MSAFFYIFINIVLPVFNVVAVGFVFQKKFKLDTGTLTKISMYILSPVIIFMKLYQTQISLELFGLVFVYIIGITVCLMIIAEVISRLGKHPRGIRKAFSNSVIMYNSGNFGLPLNELAFNSNLFAVTIQIFIMVIQEVVFITLGVYQASSGKSSHKTAMKRILFMPSLYSISLVIVVKLIDFQVPEPVFMSLNYISNCFMGLVLITLGMQLASVKFSSNIRSIATPAAIRLIVSPLIGFLLVSVMGIKGLLAQILILGVSTPAAVNTVILAREFDNEPEYASQVVFITTVASSVTVSIVLYLIRIFVR